MSLTTGTQGSSATPATDFYNLIATALTNAGWTSIGQKTAATMGTTAAVNVWATAATTVASNVYTGTIVYFEPDDTNVRLRVRCSEVFDNGATGSPATNVKWPAPGTAQSSAFTPTVHYSQQDTFQALFQTQGATATVGWINVPCAGVGFAYWLGADSTRVLFANNSGTARNWGVAGKLEYLGTSGGDGAVYLAGAMRTTNDTTSWTFTSNSTAGNVRCSREPLTTSSTAGAFAFFTGHSVPLVGTADMGGSLTTNHQWHSVLVASPAFLHGGGATPAIKRTHLARMTDFIVFSGATEPTMGDTLTISAVVYVILGRAQVNSGASPTGPVDINIAVRQGAF
jgi:hypothetical protein